MSDPIRGVSPAIPSAVGQTGTTATSTPAPTNTPSVATGAVDSADVTRAQALLAAISAAAGAVPETDQARVAELRQALRTGSYQVNPNQVAEKMSEIEALLVR